jgi:hypothetical protein
MYCTVNSKKAKKGKALKGQSHEKVGEIRA